MSEDSEREKRMDEEKKWRQDPLKLLEILDEEMERAWAPKKRKKRSRK